MKPYKPATALPIRPKSPAQTKDAAALAFNAANAAARRMDWETVRARCDAALVLDPSLHVAQLLRARALRHLGRMGDALAAYRAVLITQPQDFTAALEGGNLARHLNDDQGAMDLYTRAVVARPDDPRGHLSLARLLDASHRDKSAFHYHRALQTAQNTNGDHGLTAALVHHRMGAARLARGDAGRAVEALRAASLGLDISGAIPDLDADILIDLGDGLMRLGLEDDAAKTWEIAARATGWSALRRLSDLLYRCNRWQDALQVLERAQSLHPKDGGIGLAHADMLAEAWQLDAALAQLARLEADFPDQNTAYLALRARILGKMGDVDGANAIYETLIAEGRDGFRTSLAMSLLYSSTPQTIATRQAEMFKTWGAPRRIARLNTGAPRIGFVTADLHHQHPVNIFLQPMLAHWDQSRHPLTIYNTGKTFDAQTSLAKSRVTVWHDLDYDRLSDTVARDQIDVLIDLAGHTSGQAMSVFAKRAAPMQISFLGYPGSTGIPNMDWLIGDPIVTPPEHDALYSEQILRLPQTVFCFAPEETYPLPDFAQMARRPLTFGSFNNIPKLSPATLALWAQILHALPDSRLLLKAPSFSSAAPAARLRTIFADHGIEAARLLFRGPSALSQMMADYSDIDIALDPMPYNGGTTSLQALWMGVPVITRRGDYFVSRMGASFMQAAGLPDWVAQNDAQYVQIAVQMAQDRDRLLALKSGLRARLLSRPAWDIRAYTGDFQDGLDRIWQGADRSFVPSLDRHL